MATPSTSVDRTTTIAVTVLLIATLTLVVYVRLRLADLPLERDEGEYAYAGSLILAGVPPYELAYNMKFPGTYYAYAALMSVFGQTAWGIRMGLLAVHLATVAVVFLIGRRLLGTFAAGAGASAFALLALDRWSMSVFAHATHFVALPMAGSLLVLLGGMRSGRNWQFVTAGALAGLAIVMKQHAAPFALMAVGLAVWSARTDDGWHPREALKRGALVTAGTGLTLAALVALLAFQGVLDRFWFWTVSYASTYVSQVPVSEVGNVFLMAWGYITQANAWIWYAGVAGLGLLLLLRWTSETRAVLLAWTLAAALAVMPGFYFRQHYFIVLMPMAGLLAGVAIGSVDRLLARVTGAVPARLIAIGAMVALAGVYVAKESRYLFSMGRIELMRSLYSTNPFPESIEIARYLKEHTSADDRIAVLGSEPQIFFYADRRSATGYMYTYPLMESQPYADRMQAEFRQEVETARPKYIVFVGVPMSWGSSPQSNMGVLKWAQEFAARCYELAGIADIGPAGDAIMRWDADARAYQARFPSQVWTLSRKSACG